MLRFGYPPLKTEKFRVLGRNHHHWITIGGPPFIRDPQGRLVGDPQRQILIKDPHIFIYDPYLKIGDLYIFVGDPHIFAIKHSGTP